MTSKSLGFIGGGRITRIFLQAFANKNTKLGSVLVFDTNEEVLASLKKQFPTIQTVSSSCAASAQDIVFVALHPPVIMQTLDQIAQCLAEKTIVLSLAPKITMEKIASRLQIKNIARMIPNATSYINEGYNPVSFSKDFDHQDKQQVMQLLQLLGTTFEVEESKLEAYALISAMLPTYFWFQWEALNQLGTALGLSESESRASVQKTLTAAIHLMFESPLAPQQVMDLIPVKPMGNHQAQITEMYQSELMGLYEKIKA